MAKKLLQDMVPARRPKVNEMNLDKKIKKSEVIKPDEDLLSIHTKIDNHYQKNSNPKYTLWFVATIAIVVLLFAISSLFTKARITITPKIQDIVLDQNLSAVRDSNALNVLPFSLVSLSGEKSKTVLAGEEKDYTEKAKGTVLIYNNFSSTPQKLAIDTRLEASNGKIYKTEKEIIVPGIKEGNPGSVEVGIYANESGEEYNSAPLDFKIFGFKGTPKYDKFYARSKGSVEGGLKGTFRLISDQDKNETIKELKESLEEELFKKAKDQLPEGYILSREAVILKIDKEEVDMTSKEDELPIKISGTLFGFLFEEKVLTKKIVSTFNPKYQGDGSEIYILNIQDLKFTLLNEGNLVPDLKNINFNLSGSSKLVWKVDQENIKNSLLGKPKKDFKKILEKYDYVDSADLVLNPFWRTSIPSKFKDIKIIVNYPN